MGSMRRRSLETAGKALDGAPVELVADADLDLVERVEHVELGQRDAVEAVDLGGVARGEGVEPAAAAGPSGRDAVLAPALADELADLVLALDHLGGEGAFADARGVGADDAEHAGDALRRETQPDAGAARGRRRGGDERVGAVVNVEERGLRAFDEDGLPFARRRG